MAVDMKLPLAEEHLVHVSEKPWSDYTKADYTPEQWHRACLIHQHQGSPTSKDQCKLPVRTPNGAVNRNGVHAAMAALNGARGGVSASVDEKMRARGSLSRLYRQLGEELPGFSSKHSGMDDDEILEHFGIKGMRWGHRKPQEVSDHRESASSFFANHQRAVKAVAIAGGIAVGAILLKRGNYKLVDARSSKIYATGFKMTGRVLGKAGSTVIKTSGKLGSTVGKTSVTGVGKLVPLIGKGAYKGALGGGRIIAQNGSMFYNNVIKKSSLATVKVGSRAMTRLANRGKPTVEDVVKNSRNINPLDLLLNTRADVPGHRR